MSDKQIGWWQAWTSPTILIALVGAIAILGYTLFYRLPDVEKQLDRMRDAQVQLTMTTEKNQQQRFDRIETQLVHVRTNLLRLCMRARQTDKDCQIKELVAAVSDLGSLKAEYLSNASIELTGETPNISSASLRRLLESLKQFPRSTTSETKDEIASVLTWSTAATDAKWTVAQGALKVSFTNGSATFTPEPSVALDDLTRFAAELNNAAQTVQAAGPNLGK